MTRSPLDPETQYSQLLAEYDEALATASDESAVSPQSFVSHLANVELQQRFDRIQGCLRLLDQDRRRQAVSSDHAIAKDSEQSVPALAFSEAGGPRQIGRFRVIRRLGSGGFGVVFLAEDPVLRRHVAIKMPLASIFQSQELHARFLRECRAAAKLDHPGIVRVLESGDVNGVPYQVAEFVDGERLSDLITRERPGIPAAARLVRSLADAMQHAHDHGVLHRDIKPDNILLQPSPGLAQEKSVEELNGDQSVIRTGILPELIPRITDFGLARFVDDDMALSSSGMLVGTPKYMSPEQLKGETAAHGPQSDIYSLGVVLYQLLTGEVPFSEAVSLQARIAISENSVPPFRKAAGGISKDLETICLKCLQRRPKDRYASAGDLRDDLARFLDGRPTLARPIPYHEQMFRWVSGNRVFAALLGLVALSVLVITGQAIRNDRTSREQNKTLSSTLLQLTAEKQRADESLRLSDASRVTAERSETKFRDIAWLAQQRDYSSSIMQASAFWRNGEILPMNQIIRPFLSLNADDIRGFEWRYLWNQGQPMRPWVGHAGTVRSFEFAKEGKIAYSIGKDSRIIRWNTRDGSVESSWQLEGEGENVRADISVASQRAVISRRLEAQQRSDVIVWDLLHGKMLMRREFPLEEIAAVAISTDGHTVMVGGRHNQGEGVYLPFAQIWSPDKDTVVSEKSTFASVPDGKASVECHSFGAIRFVPARNEVIVGMTVGVEREYWHHKLLHVTLDLNNKEHPFIAPVVLGDGSSESQERGILDHICFSNDGRYFSTLIGRELGDPWSVEVWDLQKRQRANLFQPQVQSIDSMAFDSDSTKLCIGLVLPEVTPDGKSAAVGARMLAPSRSEVRLWDFVANTAANLSYHAIREVQLLKSIPLTLGDGWLVGEAGGALNAWQANAVAPFRDVPGHRPQEAWDIAFSRDGTKLFSVGDDQCLRSWDMASGDLQNSASQHSMLVSCVATSPDGRWVATGGYDDQVFVYETETLNAIATLSGHNHDLRALAFSHDGRLLATSGRDKTIRLWNVPGFNLAGVREGHKNTVRTLVWTKDGELYSADSDGRVLAWNSEGAVFRDRLEPEGVHSLAFAPAGLRISAPSAKSSGNEPDVFFPDGTTSVSAETPAILTLRSDELLAMGMNHGTVRLWHLPTDSVCFEAQHPGVEIRSLAFSPDGRTLAVAGSDSAIHLWHIPTGREVLTLNELGAAVNRVAFSLDGSQLIAALHDGTIRIWSAPNTPSH